jgi:hypothetical protein
MRLSTLGEIERWMTCRDAILENFFLFCVYTVDSFIQCYEVSLFQNLTWAEIVDEACAELRLSATGPGWDENVNIEMATAFGDDAPVVMNQMPVGRAGRRAHRDQPGVPRPLPAHP